MSCPFLGKSYWGHTTHVGHRKKSSTERGARIQHAIELRSWKKLTALAAALGVNESALTRWRKGGAISLENAARLCETLDVSLDWLVLGRVTPEHHHHNALHDSEMELITVLRRRSPAAISLLTRFLEANLPPD
jgi:transcriptional regulator with XRE-family HTH domain